MERISREHQERGRNATAVMLGGRRLLGKAVERQTARLPSGALLPGQYIAENAVWFLNLLLGTTPDLAAEDFLTITTDAINRHHDD